MARVRTGIVRRKRHKKILKEAKGFKGTRKTNFRKANEAVRRAMAFSTEHRKLKKRTMRELWIIRINAASRLNGISYSKFMNGLKKLNISLDRKVLADLAVNNASEFAKLVEQVKKHIVYRYGSHFVDLFY